MKIPIAGLGYVRLSNAVLLAQHNEVVTIDVALCNNQPIELMSFIATLEKKPRKSIEKQILPLHAADVPVTYANVDDLVQQFNYQPATAVADGINRFVVWYEDYFRATI